MSTLPIRSAAVQSAAVHLDAATLTLTIGQQLYAVAPIPYCDPSTARRAFWLTKLPHPASAGARVVYTVRQSPAGYVDCTCPDFCFRRRVCKHAAALRQLRLIDPEPRHRREEYPPCNDDAPWIGAVLAAELEDLDDRYTLADPPDEVERIAEARAPSYPDDPDTPF